MYTDPHVAPRHVKRLLKGGVVVMATGSQRQVDRVSKSTPEAETLPVLPLLLQRSPAE